MTNFDWTPYQSIYGTYKPRTELETYGGPITTCGDWQTEKESAANFDGLVAYLNAFTVLKEVRGQYTFIRPHEQNKKSARIDRILIPTTKLLEAGWTLGTVGVELKRSGKNLGRPIAQLIDYSLRCEWNIDIQPNWYFIWPVRGPTGPIASLMSQFRIGNIFRTDYYRMPTLHFQSSSRNLAELTKTNFDCRVVPAIGTAVGSR